MGFQVPLSSTNQDPVYDPNGYITNQVPVPSMDGNPWVGMANDAQGNVNTASNAAAGIPGMQNGLAQQVSAMNQYGASTAPKSYPAMANDYGLGSAPSYGGQSNAPAPSITDRGNPWMLQGDALAR
jgi:hypothetical protein